MSATELKTLSVIIRNGWKQLATEDRDDAETMAKVAIELLEALEKLESGE